MQKQYVVHFSFAILLLLNAACNRPNKAKSTIVKVDSTVFKMVETRQILLTNKADFNQHSSLNGASAFLVNYNNRVYAITAKHLIGEAGGVEPEIKLNELSKAFRSWKLFPRVPVSPSGDTVSIMLPDLNYDSLHSDILVLKPSNNNNRILPLKVNSALPTPGEKLYIIGCPYSEENCKQNIYEVQYDSYDAESAMLICTAQKLELAGFSGAPLVNINCEVVGVLTSGWEMETKFYVGATYIGELSKIK